MKLCRAKAYNFNIIQNQNIDMQNKLYILVFNSLLFPLSPCCPLSDYCMVSIGFVVVWWLVAVAVVVVVAVLAPDI